MSSKGLGFVGDGGLICGRKRCEFGAEAEAMRQGDRKSVV